MNSSICVDANVIIWSLAPAPLSEQAEAILKDSRSADYRLVAPALLAFEVTSVLRRLVHLGNLSTVQGDRAFDQFRRLQIRYTHRQAIFPVAWQLAKELNRPRAYDTAYVAVAQMNNCDLWTADRRLYNAVGEKIDKVRWIGDYSTTDSLATSARPYS